MTGTSTYTIDAFIRDAQVVVADANDDRQQIVQELTPLIQRVLWDDNLLDERYRVEAGQVRPRYIYYSAPDESLQIYSVEFAPEMPTPVHDHVTWGLIGIAGGQQATARYVRTDDGSDPNYATLELISDEVLSRGAVYPLVKPADIHRIETVGDSPSYSFHVIGVEFNNHKRNIFDPETGAITEFEGRHM